MVASFGAQTATAGAQPVSRLDVDLPPLFPLIGQECQMLQQTAGRTGNARDVIFVVVEMRRDDHPVFLQFHGECRGGFAESVDKLSPDYRVGAG
jgi:hypothetical protein